MEAVAKEDGWADKCTHTAKCEASNEPPGMARVDLLDCHRTLPEAPQEHPDLFLSS